MGKEDRGRDDVRMSPDDSVPALTANMIPEPKRVVNMISVGLGPDMWVTVWGIESLEETEEVFKRTLAKMQDIRKKAGKTLARGPDVG